MTEAGMQREGSQGVRVIVFDAEASSRRRLADALARLGHQALEAATPLEAILGLTGASRAVAFVGSRLLYTTPDEFVRFALEEFPELLLVATGHAQELRDHSDGGRLHVLDDDPPSERLQELLERALSPPDLRPRAA